MLYKCSGRNFSFKPIKRYTEPSRGIGAVSALEGTDFRF